MLRLFLVESKLQYHSVNYAEVQVTGLCMEGFKILTVSLDGNIEWVESKAEKIFMLGGIVRTAGCILYS